MPYLVRKINKRKNMDLLNEISDFNTLSADLPTGEFRTTNGTLSTWIIDSLEDINNAVLAIAVTSSKLSKMDFIVIDTKILQENDLQYQKTYAGREIAIPDLQDTHYDIVDLSLGKLANCANVYKIVYDNDDAQGKYIRRFLEGEIKDMIKTAYNDGRICLEQADNSMKTELLKLLKIA